MEMDPETCFNCGRVIGRLEQAYLWVGNIVCEECYHRLSASVASDASESPASARSEPARREAIAARPQQPSGPDSVLWAGSPSVLAYLGLYGLLGVLALGGLVLTLAGSACFAVLLLPCVLGILVLELDRQAKMYMITQHKVVCQAGVLSRKRQEMRVSDILEVTLRQDFTERLFGIGTVSIATAATAAREMWFRSVAEPGEVMRLLDSLRQ